MTEKSFPIKEVVPRPTPTCFESELYEQAEGEVENKDVPKRPQKTGVTERVKNSKIIVSGPNYGDIVVKVVKDGKKLDFYNFLITDEDNKKVKVKGNINSIPSYINAALLKSGWYCTEWGQGYTAKAVDYILTYGAVIRHLELDKKHPKVLNNKQVRISREIQFSVMDILGSRLIKTGICEDNLSKDLAEIIEQESISPVGAIKKYAKENTPKENIDTVVHVKAEEEKDENESTFAAVHRKLTEGTSHIDAPNICTSLLPEFSKEGSGESYFESGLAEDEFFHLPYNQISERYIVNKHEYEKNNTQYMQVGVITERFNFYEVFRKTGENEYVATNTECGFPAIYCVAALKENEIKIGNIPTPSGDQAKDVYKALLDTYIRFYNKNDGIHRETIKELVSILTILERGYMVLKNETTEDDIPVTYEYEHKIDEMADEVDDLLKYKYREW